MSALYTDAVDNWPEDEAGLCASIALEIFEDEGKDNYHQWLIKERQHMIKVFNDDSMMSRFCVKFNTLTVPTTNLFI